MALCARLAVRNVLRFVPRSLGLPTRSLSTVCHLASIPNRYAPIARIQLPSVTKYQHQRNYGSVVDHTDLMDIIMDVFKCFDKVDPAKIDLNNLAVHLVNDLGLDSLDIVELVMA